MASLKKRLKKSMLGKFVKHLLGKNQAPASFPGSSKYWEQRYAKNSNSGAGSYGRLADFKAEILNAFVKTHSVDTLIEYGVGDGNQLHLAQYPAYTGFDVSKTALELCKSQFQGDESKSFYHIDDNAHLNDVAQLTLSLDVLYHLIEDEVFETYMTRLFRTATRYVIIYSSNYDDHFAPHVKCRKFTPWIAANVATSWRLKEYVENRYPFDEADPNNTSMAHFFIYEKI